MDTPLSLGMNTVAHRTRTRAPKPSPVEYTFSNPLDLFLLKRNVQRNYRQQMAFWKAKAERLAPYATPVKTCLLCGSRESRVIGKTYGWLWHQCQRCTHVYNGRRLPPERYLEFYQTVEDPINYSDTYTDPEVQDYRMKRVAEPKVEYVLRYAPKRTGTWLDVATGNGDVLYIAKQKGFRVQGIEINPAAVDYGKEKWGVDIYLGRIEEFAKQNRRQWDIISFLGISDIIPNPVEYLRLAYQMLAEEGLMVMSFPNFNSLSRAVQLTYPDQLVCRFLYPSVISSYTEESATRAIERTGFRVAAIWYFGMDVYELINNLSISDARFRGSAVDELLQHFMSDLQHVFDAHKRGDEFLVVAKKPRKDHAHGSVR